MRPLRRYLIVFEHRDDPMPVKLYALGLTPCAARGQAWTMLEQLLKLSPDRPSAGWRMASQADEGIVGSGII